MRWCLVLFFVLLGAPGQAHGTTRFALIVGHNMGDATEQPLRWAEADAQRVHRTLVRIGDVLPKRARLLRSPTVAQFQQAWLETKGRLAEASDRGEQTVLFFFYSGHGDREALHFGDQRLALKKLRGTLQHGGATVTVAVIDACQNDRAPRSTSKGVVRAPAFAWPVGDLPLPQGFVFLSSAAKGEVAQESDDLQGSLFTHHFLSGIRGSADGDQDGVVTLSELYVYGHARTLSDTHARAMAVQHSEIDLRLAGQGSLVISYPARSTAILELGNAVHGYLLVVDDRSGRIVGEYHRAPAGPRRLAVVPGLYRIQLRRGAQIRVGLVQIRRGVTRLEMNDLTKQVQLSALAKGHRLDPYPWFLAAHGGLATAAVDGFGLTYGGGVAASRRLGHRHRLGIKTGLSFGRAQNDYWSYSLLQWQASASWSMEFLAGPCFLVLGAQLGLILAHQSGTRQQYLRESQVVDASLQATKLALGPRATALLGAEIPLGSRLRLSFALEPSAHLLRIDEQLAVRPGLAGAVGIGWRL